MSQILECSFNIFNEGRKYTGNHRKYVLENALSIASSDATREKISLREAFGYYGHGRRILARKMRLQEVETVKMPDGSSILLSNIPSNVTTSLVIEDDGTVRHSQEILTTETGQIVESLHQSKVGGFSWACPGADGGSKRATMLSGFEGFDYVLNPGFAMNRGYVLESADSFDKDIILESISAVVNDDAKAEQLLAGWRSDSYFEAMELRERLEQAEIYESALLEKITGKERDFDSLTHQFKSAVKAQEDEKGRVKLICDFIIESAPFFIPEEVQHALMEARFDKVQQIFEAAKRVDFGQYPIVGQGKSKQAEKPDNSRYQEQSGWEV
jgi:hypothetical protein